MSNKKNKSNKSQSTTEPKATETVKDTPVKKALTLAEVQESRKLTVTNRSVSDIVTALKANKGQVMTPVELGTALGIGASKIRHKLQKQGLSANQNPTIETDGVWLHLCKLEGGRNGYTVTPIGENPSN
ncbi:MAG: hypothetical protein KAS32_02730 [Candidatus Peribacteraceae bacterium]|nr:hypothetical protein [Candidatus Peribacteraceae bacterium]